MKSVAFLLLLSGAAYAQTSISSIPGNEAPSVSRGKINTNFTNLKNAVDAKAALSHTHIVADVTGLQTALDGKAASSHTHIVANVTGLQTSLDAATAHFARTDNPHSVTAAQVGAATAQWNANKIMGKGFCVGATFNDAYVVSYKLSGDCFEYVAQTGGSGGGSGVPYSGASGDVDLGTHGLKAAWIDTSSGGPTRLDFLAGTCPSTATTGYDLSICFESNKLYKVTAAGVKTELKTDAPTSAAIVAAFTGCGGGKYLKDDGTCDAPAGGGASVACDPSDPTNACFKDDFPTEGLGTSGNSGEWRWGGNCSVSSIASTSDHPGVHRLNNGSSCVWRAWDGSSGGWGHGLNSLGTRSAWSYTNVVKFPTIDTNGKMSGCLSEGDAEGVNEICWEFDKASNNSIRLKTCAASTCTYATNASAITVLTDTYYQITLSMTTTGTVDMTVKSGSSTQTAASTTNLPSAELIPYLYLNITSGGHQIDIDWAQLTLKGLTRF